MAIDKLGNAPRTLPAATPSTAFAASTAAAVSTAPSASTAGAVSPPAPPQPAIGAPTAPGLALRAPTEAERTALVPGATKAGALAFGLPVLPGGGATVGDRAQAALDLSPYFSIVSARTSRTKPNEVTAREFAKVAATYSDIRLGRTHLRVSDPAVMEDIAKIMQTKSGRALIDKLAYENRHDATITPLTPIEGQDLREMASKAVTDPRGAPGAKYDPKVGTASELYYLPGQVSDDGKGKAWSETPSDVMLFHELIHAYHMDRGTIPESWVTDAQGRLSASEYQATGIGDYRKDPNPSENDYRKERRDGFGESLPDRDTYR